MLRNTLSTTLRKVIEAAGYTFYEGFESRIAERSIAMPAAWMIPPRMVRINGRREGTATYRITLHLMQAAKRYTEQEKNRIWDSMEQDALGLLNHLLPVEGIFAIENIAATPAEFTLTRQGELSLRVECDVLLYFLNL